MKCQGGDQKLYGLQVEQKTTEATEVADTRGPSTFLPYWPRSPGHPRLGGPGRGSEVLGAKGSRSVTPAWSVGGSLNAAR